MAEDHRRVEPRSIVGTGMATDPARLEQIGQDAARRERAWREQPPEAFGAVLDRAPARADLADAVVPDRRRRQPDDAVDEADPSAAEAPSPATATTTAPAAARPERMSPRAPDPRAAQLHARLAATTPAKPSTSTSTSTSTSSSSGARVSVPPATGSVAPLPRGSR